MSEDSAEQLSMVTPEQAEELLGQLTPKQVEVLELLTEHLTSKLIARRLGIHPNTIDQRIGKVRDLWGTADRADTVRRYKELQAICGKTTYGSEAVDGTPADMEQVDDVVLESEMILAAEPTARMVDRDQDPSSSAERPFGLQGLDVKLGKVGRLGLVLAFAMAVAITFAAMLAISDALGRLL
jgi:DNA-binding CsgD family transcriptional regulator